MKAVLFPGDRTAIITEVEDPSPQPHEVVVRVRASAICRSDMSVYYGNPIVGTDVGTVVPGHEPAGEIVEVGSAARGVSLGDRVAIYLALGCMTCDWCRRGYLMLCAQWRCLGFDVHGGDAEYVVVPAANCLQLPPEMSFAEGALSTDMLGTQYSAQERLGVSGANPVVIFGMGPMGLAGVMVASRRGARVIAVDPIQARLDVAREVGADVTIVPDEATVVEELRDQTGGGAETLIDCSGNPRAQNWALDAAAKFGKVALVGESRETTINPSDQLLRKLVTVMGAWYFPIGQYGDISRFVVAHRLPLERMVSHRFPLDDAAEAFRLFDQRQAEKVVFQM